MNKRLVWNFELDSTALIVLDVLCSEVGPIYQKNGPKFEARYFWDEDKTVILRGLGDFLLELSHFKIKHKLDKYYLIPGQDYNIKQRRDTICFKPLVYKGPVVCGFSNKVAIEAPLDDSLIPGLVPIGLRKLKQLMDTEACAVSVKKTTLTYKFQALDGRYLGAKLELARLGVEGRHYFSASIEGHDKAQVEFLATQLFEDDGNGASDYVRFLKEVTETK